MAEQVDRRGFLRSLRRGRDAEKVAEPEAEGVERELTPKQKQILELAEYSSRLLPDFTSEDEEQLAEGPLITKAFDQAYMRVTSGHIVYCTVLGNAVSVGTADVVAFDTDSPVDAGGHGVVVFGVLRAHHPADLPHITRSYAFNFPAASPLLSAIRSATGIPEPEPEPEAEVEGGDSGG